MKRIARAAALMIAVLIGWFWAGPQGNPPPEPDQKAFTRQDVYDCRVRPYSWRLCGNKAAEEYRNLKVLIKEWPPELAVQESK